VTRLIYIGGYGRSGTTLLESLLTGRSDLLACGEVVCCLRKRIERLCTCGETRQNCKVWGSIYKTVGPLRGWTHQTLTLALLEHAADHYNLLVDSSKTAWGSLSAPFALRRKLGRKIHLVHVVRDPRGVCWSNMAGNWKERAVIKNPAWRHFRTTLGWWAANFSSELFGWRYPDQYVRIRYEDIAESPRETLDSLFSRIAPGREAPSTKVTEGGNRHQLYGNHARYGELTLSNVREDVRWRTEMPIGQQRLVSVLTWPLDARYRYC